MAALILTMAQRGGSAGTQGSTVAGEETQVQWGEGKGYIQPLLRGKCFCVAWFIIYLDMQ